MADVSVFLAELNTVIDWRKSMLFLHVWHKLLSRWNDKDPCCATKAKKDRIGKQSHPIRPALRYCLRWCAPSLSASHTIHGWILPIIAGSGAKVILQKCCFFYFHNSGADKRLPSLKNWINLSCDNWGNVIYAMETFTCFLMLGVFLMPVYECVYTFAKKAFLSEIRNKRESFLLNLIVWPNN